MDIIFDSIVELKNMIIKLYDLFKEWVLEEQVKERSDTSFKRGCMFCRTEFSGSRVDYVKHLYQKHNILLGKPENLVFIDEFLDKVQNNIERFVSFFPLPFYQASYKIEKTIFFFFSV